MRHETSVASPKSLGVLKKFGARLFDFRQITVFSLGYRLSRHKITIQYKNYGVAIAPWLRLCLMTQIQVGTHYFQSPGPYHKDNHTAQDKNGWS